MPSTSLTSWDRLVRYISATDNQEKYGEPILTSDDADIAALARNGSLEVNVLEGDDPLSAKPNGQRDKFQRFQTHIKETSRNFPECPTVFTKSAPAVAGHDEAIPIPKIAQQQCDYEGELVIEIGCDAKDVSPENALDYVAGFTCGNDVSARDYQRDTNKAGVVPQWSFSKSFDKYAPVGPVIVSPKLLGAAAKQELKTFVNGELRQQGNTDDLCYGVRALVAWCSQGQTLQKGSLIETGTPGGVGLFISQNLSFSRVAIS